MSTFNVQDDAVAVPASGAGAVRTLDVQILTPAGTIQTASLQVIAIADPKTGETIQLDDLIQREWQRQMLDELRAIRLGIQLIVTDDDAVTAARRDKDLLTEAQGLREELMNREELE